MAVITQADDPAAADEQEQPARKRRLRIPANMPAPPSGQQPYAKSRAELKGVTSEEITLWVMQAPEWTQAMKPVLDAIDQERAQRRRGRSGSRPAYSAEQIEKALLFGKVCGFTTYKETYMKLCADRKARQMLGFTQPNAKRATRHEDGVPSPATVSRHIRRFGHERRGEAWDTLARLLRDFHVANFPEMQEEMRVSDIDGSRMRTHYTTPIKDPKTGETVNEDKVQCETGGYMPYSAGEKKCGNGWRHFPLLTATAVPWAWPKLPPMIHDGEGPAATKLALEEAKDVLALIPNRKLGVLTADTNFTGHDLRAAVRQLGMVENIHMVSHKRQSEARAEEFRNEQITIDEYPNWFADGHRQIFCACGEGHTFSRFSMAKTNRSVARVEGACANCGSITITSGEWKLVQNPKQFTRVDVNKADEEPDYLLGNPLTFDDLLSKQFGNGRFGHNEGFFGTLWKRFSLGEKRWYHTIYQAQAELGMIYSIIHVSAMEQRRRKHALTLSKPPSSP
jgi:hypothetical protein